MAQFLTVLQQRLPLMNQMNEQDTYEITPLQFQQAFLRYAGAGLRGLEITKAIEAEHVTGRQAALQATNPVIRLLSRLPYTISIFEKSPEYHATKPTENETLASFLLENSMRVGQEAEYFNESKNAA